MGRSRAEPDLRLGTVRWYSSLRRPGEISFVRRSGLHARAATVAAHASQASGGNCRIAVTVSKAVGKAVVRNLVKRRIKGALDGLRAPGRPLRIVLVARPEAGTEPYERLARDVEAVMARFALA
jgi:ribonuclease P protein component